MDRNHETRYVLTEKGIRFLAEQAGVTPAVLQKRGGIRPRKGWTGDQQPGVRHVEHTIGTDRVLARLATDARAKGGRLVEVRNDAESACGFTDARGRASAVRPDASGIVEVAGIRLPFLLEYDRGTLDAGDFRGKFEGYRRYYAGQHWRAAFEREPLLLFVCVDARAERRVLDGARSGSSAAPLLATTEVRCGRSGAFEAIWQASDGGYRKLLDKPSAPRAQGHRDAG